MAALATRLWPQATVTAEPGYASVLTRLATKSRTGARAVNLLKHAVETCTTGMTFGTTLTALLEGLGYLHLLQPELPQSQTPHVVMPSPWRRMAPRGIVRTYTLERRSAHGSSLRPGYDGAGVGEPTPGSIRVALALLPPGVSILGVREDAFDGVDVSIAVQQFDVLGRPSGPVWFLDGRHLMGVQLTQHSELRLVLQAGTMLDGATTIGPRWDLVAATLPPARGAAGDTHRVPSTPAEAGGTRSGATYLGGWARVPTVIAGGRCGTLAVHQAPGWHSYLAQLV